MKTKRTEVEILTAKMAMSFNELSNHIKLDKKWFKRFGIEEDRIELFEQKVTNFQKQVLNVSDKSRIVDKQNEKIQIRKKLRMSIRKVLLTMMFAWPEGHPMAEIYSFPSFAKMNDYELANSGRIILLVAHNHKENLKHFGLKEEFLYQLSVLIAKLSALHSELETLNREEKIRNLILKQKAIELIQEAKIYAKIGRTIWVKRDKTEWKKYKLPYATVKKIMENDVGFNMHPNPY